MSRLMLQAYPNAMLSAHATSSGTLDSDDYMPRPDWRIKYLRLLLAYREHRGKKCRVAASHMSRQNAK